MTSQAPSDQQVRSSSTMKELAVVRSKSVPEREREVAPGQPLSTQSSEDSEEESSEKKPSTEPESEVGKEIYIHTFIWVIIRLAFIQTFNDS